MKKNVKVSGYIVELERDYETEEIIIMGIETDEGDVYIFEDETIISELEDYIGDEIEVSGRVWTEVDGEQYIRIKSYNLI